MHDRQPCDCNRIEFDCLTVCVFGENGSGLSELCQLAYLECTTPTVYEIVGNRSRLELSDSFAEKKKQHDSKTLKLELSKLLIFEDGSCNAMRRE